MKKKTKKQLTTLWIEYLEIAGPTNRLRSFPNRGTYFHGFSTLHRVILGLRVKNARFERTTSREPVDTSRRGASVNYK